MKLRPAAWTFRQSWTKNLLLCPERGRRSVFDPDWQDHPGDAVTLGTALHEYAEMRLRGWAHHEAAHHASEWLDGQIESQAFQFVQIKTAKTMHATLDRVVDRYRSVIDRLLTQYGLPPAHEIERSFDVPLSPDGSIRLEGTWDVRWPAHRVIGDHKTAARLDRYVDWEVQRWYVQPTFYCVAADLVDLVDACGGDEERALEAYWADIGFKPTTFEFYVVDKSTNPDTKTSPAERNHRHGYWLLEQLEAVVNTYEKMGPEGPWLKNDQHALCSAKWCPAWDDCKGKHL